MSRGSDFEVATKAELIRLAAEAANLRPGHNCHDLAPCRHCAAYRRKHAEIDDFLSQLRGEPVDDTPAPLSPLQNALLASYAAEKIDDRTCDPICRCGRSKAVVGNIALMCRDCDAVPLPTLGLGGDR